MRLSRKLPTFVVALTASWFAAIAQAESIIGTVVGVSDGDTVTVLDVGKIQHKVRLNGIDAPESHQAFGQRAKQALSSKVFQKTARIETHEKDRYGRTIGDVFVGDRFINAEMVREGWAWHFLKYSTSQDLAEAESEARKSKLGLWADASPIAPWDFRKPGTSVAHFASEQGKVAANAATVYVTKTGTKYHSGGCRHLSKSQIPISLSEAKGRYAPCSVCKPPQSSEVMQ